MGRNAPFETRLDSAGATRSHNLYRLRLPFEFVVVGWSHPDHPLIVRQFLCPLE